MADMERLYQALRNADQAGDTAAAKRLADFIRSQQAPGEEPASTKGQANLAGATAAAQTSTFGFAENLQAGLETANYAVRELFSPRSVEVEDLVGYYRERRDAYREEAAQLAEAEPLATAIGTAAGLAPALAGGNPVGAVRGIAAGGRALLTNPRAVAAGARSLLSVEGAKAVGAGAAYGGLAGAGASEADLTRGEVGKFVGDVAGGAGAGAVVGGAARGLLGAGSAVTAARAERAATDAGRARAAADFDAALAAYPDELAAVKAANAAEKEAAALENAAARESAAVQNQAAREAASSQNAASREAATTENAARRLQYRTDTAAAKAEAKAATRANQSAAEEAEIAAARANPLRRTGLESKLQSQYGPKVAKERAQALVNEAMPGQPGKRLIEEAEKLSPEARYDYAQGLRMGEGQKLGAIRDELAKVPGASVPVAPIKAALQNSLGSLPTEVQAKGLKQIEAMIKQLSKDGTLAPAALRKLIEDTNALAKYGSPRLESALGRSQKRIFRTAYSELVNRERELIGRVLPEAKAAEYSESLRKYAVYSDFEQSADVLLRRANKGLPAIKVKKAAPVAPVAPREVSAPEKVKPAKVKPQLQEPALREPALKPEPALPEFAGGEAELASGRRLLQPSLGARVVAGGLRIAAADTAARVGSLLSVPGSAVASSRLASAGAEAIGERWLRWVTATPGSLSARAAKLDRLRPMMEEALRRGPAEIARIHALFMQRSPEYRKAIESNE